MNSFGRSKHKREDTAEHLHPITGEKTGMEDFDRVGEDIFTDKEAQARFFKFAEQEDQAMAQSIAESLHGDIVLTKQQNDFFEKTREKYNLRSMEISHMQEHLTPDQLELIARLNPEIASVVGKIGSEKAAELFRREFGHLALTNEAEYKKMMKRLQNLEKLANDKGVQETDRTVGELLTKYNISMDDYEKATASGSATEKQANLHKLIVRDMGYLKRAGFAVANWTRQSDIGWVLIGEESSTKLRMGSDVIQKVLHARDTHLAGIGKVLKATLTPELQLEVQRAMMKGGEVKDQRAESTVMSIQETQNIKSEIASRQGRFEEELKKRKIIDRTRQAVDFEKAKEEFATQEFKKQESYKGQGVIAGLLTFLFTLKTKDDIKNSLT